jgi:hypothetical protein
MARTFELAMRDLRGSRFSSLDEMARTIRREDNRYRIIRGMGTR